MATLISVINASTVLDDAETERAVPALSAQVNEEFMAAWGIAADLKFVRRGDTPPPGSWWLLILDNSDQAGALGYHDLTPEGLPMAKVFAGTDKHYGLQWTVTASHELLEMLVDPDINLTVFVQKSRHDGVIYAYEVCDPCEADADGYVKNGILVSNFVYPEYFETFRKTGSVAFDYRHKLTGPIPTMLPGGYLSAFDITGATGWHQINGPAPASGTPSRSQGRARVGSRRERRGVPREEWITGGDDGSGTPGTGTAQRAPAGGDDGSGTSGTGTA